MFVNPTVGAVEAANGSTPNLRAGKQGQLVVGQYHGGYYESAYFKANFSAANQAATTVSVGLATTYTGLVLSNPAGSGVNLAPRFVGFALDAAPAAIAPIGLLSGFSSAGLTTHTTPLTPVSDFLGQPAGVGLADAAATLPTTPRWHMSLMGGFTAASLPSSPLVLWDLKESILIPPGGYLAIGALTAVTGLGSISWAEFLI